MFLRAGGKLNPSSACASEHLALPREVVPVANLVFFIEEEENVKS